MVQWGRPSVKQINFYLIFLPSICWCNQTSCSAYSSWNRSIGIIHSKILRWNQNCLTGLWRWTFFPISNLDFKLEDFYFQDIKIIFCLEMCRYSGFTVWNILMVTVQPTVFYRQHLERSTALLSSLAVSFWLTTRTCLFLLVKQDREREPDSVSNSSYCGPLCLH